MVEWKKEILGGVKVNVARYVNTEKENLKFELKFVTPAFLGGADMNAEMRVAPFKFGIRYWWRVLYGSKHLDNLKEIEDYIFGSTEQKSKIIISADYEIKNAPEKKGFPNGKKVDSQHQGKTIKVNILDYLAYGKYSYEKGIGNVYSSSYFLPESIKITFRVILDLEDSYKSEIKDAIKAFIKFGGVGSRSRNGLGCVASKEIRKLSWSSSLSSQIKNGRRQAFPTISNYLKYFETKQTFDTWEDALSAVGEIYKNARCSLENQHRYEQRSFVARPIEVKGENIPPYIRNGRFPKTFFLGVVKSDNKFVGRITYLPVVFYESKTDPQYQNVISKMNKEFASKMNDKTAALFSEIGGGK